MSSIAYGNVKTAYTYGDYGRLRSKTETVDNKSFQFSYSYNDKGQLEMMTYPNSKSIKYEYANGDLSKIIWQPNATTVWQKSDENAKGQILSVKLGNGLQGSFAYDAIGAPTSIRALKGTTALLDIAYQNNDSRGNIRNRKDLVKSQDENFTYDNLNRLISDVEYTDNGNITYKWDAGTYSYEEDHPHAISGLSSSKSLGLSSSNLTVAYNSVRLPVEITEAGKTYTLTYGAENHRIKSQYKENNTTIFTKYYSGPYEEIEKGGVTQKNCYIYAGGEIVAVNTEGASDNGLYYFHNDHLGTPWVITNASGSEVQRLNFNAWGRRRDASDWNNYGNLPDMKFDRGFTGHEHLEMFGLINMNARLYDPVLGRFLSPDPIVQVPDFTQAYNGYSYALNNPLSYTDPNGEFLFTALIPGVGVFLDAMIVGAAVGAVGGGVKSAIQGQNFWNGAWKGAITGGVGGLLAPIGGAGMSFAANVGLGAAQGALVGSLDAALWGTSVGKGLLWGCISGASFATLTSANMKNMIKGKGFKSNQSVFKDFSAGKYTAEGGVWQQDALDYFGFEGEYDPNILGPNYVDSNMGAYGATDPISKNIRYGDGAFDSFDNLKGTYYKEMFHRERLLSGKKLLYQDTKGLPSHYKNFYYAPEETKGFIHQYKNMGLYPKISINSFSQVSYYQFNTFDLETFYNKRWWHFIYKTPRRW